MGFEQELLPVIRQISQRSATVEEAIGSLEAALEAEIGSALLIFQPSSKLLIFQPSSEVLSPLALESVSSFLNSRDFPFRGVYTATSRVGRVVACFGAFTSSGQAFGKLTELIAVELSGLSERLESGHKHKEAA